MDFVHKALQIFEISVVVTLGEGAKRSILKQHISVVVGEYLVSSKFNGLIQIIESRCDFIDARLIFPPTPVLDDVADGQVNRASLAPRVMELSDLLQRVLLSNDGQPVGKVR